MKNKNITKYIGIIATRQKEKVKFKQHEWYDFVCYIFSSFDLFGYTEIQIIFANSLKKSCD